MTDSRETAVIGEALSVIDKALREMLQRELVSTGEVADLLLDVRSLLIASAVAVTPIKPAKPTESLSFSTPDTP